MIAGVERVSLAAIFTDDFRSFGKDHNPLSLGVGLANRNYGGTRHLSPLVPLDNGSIAY